MLVPMFPALEDADATKNILFHGGTKTTRWRRRRRGSVTDARCLRTLCLDCFCRPPLSVTTSTSDDNEGDGEGQLTTINEQTERSIKGEEGCCIAIEEEASDNDDNGVGRR